MTKKQFLYDCKRVREYALQLLSRRERIAQAVSMLANNYKSDDYSCLVESVKQIPISDDDGTWHGAFSDVLRLIQSKEVKHRPKKLLPYLYRNTLCSCCRANIVAEMGRRRMLTKELLEELLHDANEDIRRFADKKLDRLGRS